MKAKAKARAKRRRRKHKSSVHIAYIAPSSSSSVVSVYMASVVCMAAAVVGVVKLLMASD
jgi:hypothetical protein